MLPPRHQPCGEQFAPLQTQRVTGRATCHGVDGKTRTPFRRMGHRRRVTLTADQCCPSTLGKIDRACRDVLVSGQGRDQFQGVVVADAWEHELGVEE